MKKTSSAQVTTWDTVVTSVHDGDTFNASIILGAAPHGADLDYGFHIYKEHPDGGNAKLVLHASVRLLGCNAQELNQPGGKEARDALLSLLPIGSHVLLSTASPDKYGGRYDAIVSLEDGTNVIMYLTSEQWVAPWTGTGPKPVPPWPRTVN